MQVHNLTPHAKEKPIQASNPLKQLFSHNLSPRYKAPQNTKPKISASTIQLGSKYCYSLHDLIGSGYTSKVYKGYEIQNQSKVFAIKVIDRKRLNEDQIKLVKNQIEVHPKLDHQNIVKCYDVFDTPKTIYIVLEFCPNGDLSQHIEENKNTNVSEKTAIQLIQQIIEGYRYLIKQGVLHRDLKPPNILKSGRTLKIADFGFAVKGKKTLIDNMSVGTPLYMPPQSIQECVYSHKSDFFALGCIMYEILHGKTPWFKKDEKALATVMKKSQIDLSKVQNYNIREFILGACEISQSYRMSIDQFVNFDFKKAPVIVLMNFSGLSNPQSANNARSFVKQKTDRRQASKKSREQKAKSIKSKKSQTAMEATFVSNHIYFKSAKCQETKIITAQFQQKFQLCLLLKYLIQNADESILLEDFDKKNLKIVLFRHCIYLLKRIISDCVRTKSFDLKNWETYRQGEQFKNFEEECKKIKLQMQKDFNLHLKGMSIKNLSEVNKKFSQLSLQYDLTKVFYQKLSQFLRQTMLKFHSQITKKFTKTISLSPFLVNSNSKYFEAFKALYRYYENNQQNMSQNFEELNRSSAFKASDLKTANTTKNSSNVSSTVNYHMTNKSANKVSLKKQIELLGSGKNISSYHPNDDPHYYNCSVYKSPEHQKAKIAELKITTMQCLQYPLNSNIKNNFHEKQQPGSAKYAADKKIHQHQAYMIRLNHVYSDRIIENNTNGEIGRNKKLQISNVKENSDQSVQSCFGQVLCRNFSQSKMTKQEFIGMKKKIRWLW